jgi:hypothetical protein
MTSGDEYRRGRWSAIIAFAGFGLAVAEIVVGLIGALVFVWVSPTSGTRSCSQTR